MMHDQKLLYFFRNLGDSDEYARCLAGHGLIQALHRATSSSSANPGTLEDEKKGESEDVKSMIDYALQRLSRGLASDRDCVRLGHCSTLAQTLRVLSGNGAVNVRDFIEQVAKPLLSWTTHQGNDTDASTSTPSQAEESGSGQYQNAGGPMLLIPAHSREAHLCEQFLCKALVESRVFLETMDRSNERVHFARFLTCSLKKIHDGKEYLQEAAAHLFLEFVQEQLLKVEKDGKPAHFGLAQELVEQFAYPNQKFSSAYQCHVFLHFRKVFADLLETAPKGQGLLDIFEAKFMVREAKTLLFQIAEILKPQHQSHSYPLALDLLLDVAFGERELRTAFQNVDDRLQFLHTLSHSIVSTVS